MEPARPLTCPDLYRLDSLALFVACEAYFDDGAQTRAGRIRIASARCGNPVRYLIWNEVKRPGIRFVTFSPDFLEPNPESRVQVRGHTRKRKIVIQEIACPP